MRVGSYLQEIAGEFHIQVTASPGHGLEEVQDVIETELERIRREPPSAREIGRAKNRIETDHARMLEHFGGFGGRADQLNFYNVLANDPGVINSDIQRYTAVVAEDVTRVAASVLGGDRVRLAVLSEKRIRASARTTDRSVMPVGSPPRVFRPPVPRREQLSNGLNILYIEKPGLPVVAQGIVLRAGSVTDPTDRPGLAHMTADMLSEGTTTLSSQQIAEEMEYLGSRLGIAAGHEHTALSAETLTPHWPRALEIMADVAQNATFPPQELERVRRERLTDLRRIADDPIAVSNRASRALVYGQGTRYGHPVGGTEESIGALTREEIVSYFETHYGPRDATFIVVGDVTRDDVMSKAEACLGGWRDSAAGRWKDAAGDGGPPSAPTTLYLVDKPRAAQSIIRAGHLTIPRLHPDYYSLNMLNFVFGGHPMARLFLNLRQDKGYSYGYYSTVDWLTGPSAIFAGGAVATGVTKEAVIETLKEFADIRGERPVTLDEFTGARDGMLRAFPSQFETQTQLLSQLSRLVMFGLPDDYYATLTASLQALTLEDLHRVAAKRIQDRHLVVLVVGDRNVVQPGLQELGLPLVIVDHEGLKVK